MASKMEAPNLLCACQGEDDGMISISFYYGLTGMGKRTPIKVIFPAIGEITDAFEDIKEKLQKIAKKVSKRERKIIKLEQHLTEDDATNPNIDPLLPDKGIITLSSIIVTENTMDTSPGEDENEHAKLKDSVVTEKDHEDSMQVINLSIMNQGCEIDTSNSNADGWRNNHNFVIDICGVVVKYAIFVNPPRITTLELPKTIMTGYMLYPKFDMKNCKPEMCNFSWYKCKKKPKHNISNTYKQLFVPVTDKDGSTQIDDGKNKDSFSTWTFIQSGFVYVPTEDDLGYFLKLTCDTKHMFGEQNVYVPCEYAESKYVIRNGPGVCPFEKRQLETTSRTPPGRIMTYNILADVYANTKSAVDYFYPYCAPYALSLDYRKQLFMKEILGYNCDIICLQEVDQKVYRGDFETIFTRNGYSGEMKTRCKFLSQGVAIYYKQDKFINVGTHHIELTSSLMEGTIHKKILEKVSKNKMLVAAVQELKTMLMVTALQPVEASDKVVLVATTHLSCGPRKANRRILQTITALQHLAHITEDCYGNKDVSLVFCGDFNSLPESGVVELITKGEVSDKHADWFTGGRTEFVSGMSLKAPVCLKSAYENPYYTNYVSGFYGTIDYIFHEQKKLETTQTVPLPDHRDVIQDTACPSVKFPSDHLSLICDFKFVT